MRPRTPLDRSPRAAQSRWSRKPFSSQMSFERLAGRLAAGQRTIQEFDEGGDSAEAIQDLAVELGSGGQGRIQRYIQNPILLLDEIERGMLGIEALGRARQLVALKIAYQLPGLLDRKSGGLGK